MSDVYTPPAVWGHDQENGGQFAGINRPTAGAREERELPVGEHPFQLYSLGTPNGMKVGVIQLLKVKPPVSVIGAVINICSG